MLQSENARYIHSPTHPNTLILCTQHACPHTLQHAQIVHASCMHPPIQTRAQYVYIYMCALHTCTHILRMLRTCTTHLNILVLCTLHTWWYMHPPTLTCAYCACYMYIPAHGPSNTRISCTLHTCTTHLNIRMLRTIHTCTHLHNMRILCMLHIHAPPTLTFARCARYIHAHIYPTHTPRA